MGPSISAEGESFEIGGPKHGVFSYSPGPIMTTPKFWFCATWHRVKPANRASALCKWLVRVPVVEGIGCGQRAGGPCVMPVSLVEREVY